MDNTEFDYLRITQELLSLEEKNLVSQLDSYERERWTELTRNLFGLSETLSEKRKFFRVVDIREAEVIAPERDPDAKVRSLSCGGLFVETRCLPKVGSEMDLEVSFTERRDVRLPFRVQVRWISPALEEGSQGVGVSFIDLDKRQRSAILAALREHLTNNLEFTLEKLRFFFKYSPDVAILIDRNATILEGNDQARSHLAPEAGDIKGMKLMDILPRDSANALLECIAKVRTGASPSRVEIQISNQDRSDSIPFEVMVASGRSKEIDLGVLIVGRDLSERMEIEKQRRILERRLYQADKLASLGQITAGIAHDINNPLAWAISNLSLLEAYIAPLQKLVSEYRGQGIKSGSGADAEILKEIDENLIDLVKESVQGVRRIRDIIRDLKMFSRIDVAQEAMTDINEALETSLRMVRNQVDQRAKLVKKYDKLPETYINFGKIGQVFLNLLTNAVRSFETLDVEQNVITLRTWAEGDEIFAGIRDNGRGIPPELQQKIFEPFYTGSTSEGGTGLGLTIAMDALKILGGGLELSSEVGVGTEFTVRIPVLPCLNDLVKVAEKKPSVPPLHRPKILIVDDEAALVRSLKRSLARRWNVLTACSVDDAVKILAETSVEAILCDVMIPGKSGTTLFAQTKKLYPGLERRIIFMTGGVFAEQEKAVLDNISNPIIEKPFDMEEIENLLINMISL
jgi:PAS domain S-box-containing protein